MPEFLKVVLDITGNFAGRTEGPLTEGELLEQFQLGRPVAVRVAGNEKTRKGASLSSADAVGGGEGCMGGSPESSLRGALRTLQG